MKTSEFKNLIKECVREVLKEELQGIKQQLSEHSKTIQPLKKVGGFTAPNYNTTGNPPENFKNISQTGDPLIDLLNETKIDMSGEDWKNFGHFDNARNFNPNTLAYGNEPQVGTVGDMLSSAPKTNDINQIEIDVVPNYSQFMGALKEQGKI